MAELVVQDAESYQQILNRLERFVVVETIRLGIAAAEEGRVRPTRKALVELQEKLGISGVMSGKRLKPRTSGFAGLSKRFIRSKNSPSAAR